MFIFIYIRRRNYSKNLIQKVNSIDDKLPIYSLDEIGTENKCSICRVHFKPKQDIVACPNCKDYFHLGHIQKWLQENFSCPMCKYDFEILFFDDEKND